MTATEQRPPAAPTNPRLRAALKPLLAREGQVVRAQLLAGRRADLRAFDEPLADAAWPHLLPSWLTGAGRAVRDAKEAATRRVRHKAVMPGAERRSGPTPSLAGSFGGHRPEAVESIRRAALEFARSTNRTSELAADRARERVREELIAGLSANEAPDRLSARIATIFRSPMRAARIALTETIRALNAGELAAAVKLGVAIAKGWRTHGGCCDRCKELSEREPIGLLEPFDVDEKGGPYAVCLHPPLHPWCRCSLRLVYF